MSGAGSGLSAKRVQLLKEAVPGLSRVAILAYAAGASTERDWGETHAAGLALGLSVQRHDVRVPGDFEGAFGAMAAQGAEALIMLVDSFFGRDGGRAVVDLAARYRLPSMHEHRVFTEAGGLLSCGANVVDTHRRAATYVDKILKGAKPADLPVEQPTTFDFVVNLKTAQTLDLAIPQSVLLQATEAIR